MKSFSNTYIFIFSAIMVVVVAALLAVVAGALKPTQEYNLKVEQFQNILSSARIESTKKNAEELYNQYITESFVINPSGEKLEVEDVLSVDMKAQVAFIEKLNILEARLQEKRKSPFRLFLEGFISFEEVNRQEVNVEIDSVETKRQLPVYICEKEGENYFIVPVRGKGLWGPIWGYISLKDDLNTIYGTVFDHKTETPGLGSKITEDWFEDSFRDLQIMDETNEFRSVKVVKGGAAVAEKAEIDAISGATITCVGVEDMLKDCLKGYLQYFENQRN